VNILREIQVAPKRELPILAIGAFVGGALAGPAGYFFAKKKLTKHFEQVLLEEVQDAKAFYKAIQKPDPTELAQKHIMEDVDDITEEDLRETVRELHYVSDELVQEEEAADIQEAIEEEIEHEEQSRHRNVFRDSPPPKDPWNQADEEALREELDVGSPYVVSFDEFQEHGDYDNITLTYFEEDDVLVDERDQPIEEVESVVGGDNLTKFGHGSKDNNVVYIRNNRLEADFEVMRSRGSFAKEILGFIEHSDKSGKIRKFRSDDE
jgi:hypothetical protein